MARVSGAVSTFETLYRARKGRIDFVDVPEMGFIALDGRGAPGGDAFTEAIRVLYSIAYGAHFSLKRSTGVAPRMMPLEALW